MIEYGKSVTVTISSSKLYHRHCMLVHWKNAGLVYLIIRVFYCAINIGILVYGTIITHHRLRDAHAILHKCQISFAGNGESWGQRRDTAFRLWIFGLVATIFRLNLKDGHAFRNYTNAKGLKMTRVQKIYRIRL